MGRIMWFGVLKEYLMCIRAVWGPVIVHRGALAANHQQAHSLKVRMSATTRERRQEWVAIQLPRQFL